MTRDVLARRLKALADPVRLKILGLLPVGAEKCDDVYNVSELAAEIGLAQPSVSHHLSVLRNAGFVGSKKMCRDVYYFINPKQTRAIVAALNDTLQESL